MEVGLELKWDVYGSHMSGKKSYFAVSKYSCSSDKPPEVRNNYMQLTKKFQEGKQVHPMYQIGETSGGLVFIAS